MEFNQKIAVISGGNRGIGKKIVQRLHEKKAIIYFCYLNHTEAIQQIIDKADKTGIYPIQCDVTKSDEVKKMIQMIQNKHDKIDFLINNAGINKDKALAFMSNDDWYSVINTNLNGCFNFSRFVITEMMKQKSGKIINITSTSGITGSVSQCNYASSKGGIISFTKSLAKEVAAYGITVNAVAPGYIKTDMTEKLSEKHKLRILESIPLKKYGNTDDVASLVLFLLSDNADYITGEVIRVDGGLAI